MMKTITDYRPMIFSEMAANAQKRALGRRRFIGNAKISLGYFTAGFWMIWDTGFAPGIGSSGSSAGKDFFPGSFMNEN